jgi:hypothetical protein
MIKISIQKIFLPIILSVYFFSCKKIEASLVADQATAFEKYFESSILNQNFIVILASTNGTDITSNYKGYQFMMLKTDYYHGPIQVTKDATTFTGTWSSNEDYSKLVITLPTAPPEFIFLTREWRFTGKNLPQLDLSPWGTNDPFVLHILRQ